MHRRLLGLGLFALSCSAGSPTSAKARPPPLVATQFVALEDVPVVVRAPTDLRSLHQVDVGAKTLGYLDAVLVDRGDRVKKGQLVALVRPSDLPDQLSSARGAVAQAEATNTLANSNLERGRALAPRGLLSEQELQTLTGAKAASDAQLAAAQANLAALGTRFGETRLESPMDGVVVARRLDPGALVGPATGAVLTIARVDTLRAYVPVGEKYAGRLAVGQTARLQFDGLDAKSVEARVERLAPAFDPLTRTLDAELRVGNAQGLLRPGMYGRAEIQLELHQQVPLVPASAVQYFDEQSFVYIVEGDTARRRRVQLGEDLGDRLEVTVGLRAGEELVVRGIDSLSDGAKVRRAGRSDAGVGAAPPLAPSPTQSPSR
jgi:RND family efflux transporter MFP subunit